MTQKAVTPRIIRIWSTPDPRRVVAIAARMTYSNIPVDQLQDKLTDAEIDRSVKAILERRHYSVLRHVSFSFAVTGVGRAFSHQLVRHAAGHAYEQRSQHYRTEKDFDYVLPGTVELAGQQESYVDFMSWAQDYYDELMKAGVPKEDARQVLPNAVETHLIWTANLEGIVNFVKARACRVNTQEIKSIASLVRREVIKDIPEAAPYLGPTCLTQGVCYEGQKFFTACNKPWQTPTVLWTPEFPKKIQLVGVGGEQAEVDGLSTYAVNKKPHDV